MDGFKLSLLLLPAILVILSQVQSTDGKRKNLLSRLKKRGPSVKKALATVQYVELTKEQAAAYQQESVHRQRRAADTKENAKIQKILKAYENTGLSGDVLYIARKEMILEFQLDQSLLNGSTVIKSELQLYKKITKKVPKLTKKHKTLPEARLTIHQTITEHKLLGDTKVVSSLPVKIQYQGWIMLEVNEAVSNWITDPTSNKGLQVWVESSERGKLAARIARKTRFVKPTDKREELRPVLVIYYTKA